MKIAVLPEPDEVDLVAGTPERLFLMRQAVKGRQQIRLPVDATVFDRPAQRQALDFDARLHQIQQVPARRRRDTEPLVLLENHQALDLEPHQRFSDGAAADPVALAKAFDAQAFVRHQPARHDIDPELTEHLGVDRRFDCTVMLSGQRSWQRPLALAYELMDFSNHVSRSLVYPTCAARNSSDRRSARSALAA